MSETTLAVHAAREGDGYWRSKGDQWSLLCSHMSSTAKVTLGILCSLTGQTHPVRNLTASELAGLLSKGPVAPGESPKAMSASGAIRVLRELADLGQITRPDGSRLTISSRPTAEISICVWTLPRHDCGCARNVHDALNALRGEPSWFPAAGRGQNSDHASSAGQNSDQAGENSDQAGQNSAKKPPVTCDDAPPFSSSPSSSSLSDGHRGPTGAPSGVEEREAAAPKDNPPPAKAPSPVTPGESVVASYVAASRHSVPASLRRQMLRQARELLEAGRSEAFLVERAAEMPDNGWRDLVQHVQAWEKARRRKSGSPGLSVVSAERCPEHPQYYRAGCVDCALAVPA